MNKFCGILLAATVVGVASSPALALPSEVQGYASGSTTMVLMNGASQSVGAEIAAPPQTGFLSGTVGVTPLLTTVAAAAAGGLGINANSYVSLLVNPGALSVFTAATSPSVETAVATKITTAGIANLSDGVSYTRAWQSGLQ